MSRKAVRLLGAASEQERAAYIASLEPIRSLPRDRCYICNKQGIPDTRDAPAVTDASLVKIVYHHVWRQADGGKNLPTIALCADHHNHVHDVATRLISLLKKGQKIDHFIWRFGGDSHRASQLVMILVFGWMNPLEIAKRLQLVLEGEPQRDFEYLKECWKVSDQQVIEHALRLAAAQQD